MKCPKCGYNSFEYHDTCTKCSNDLIGFKDTYGLKPIVLPLEVRVAMAEAMMAETATQVADAVDAAPNDMFSFDLPDDGAVATASISNDDPFSFDDEPAPAASGGGAFSFDEDQHEAQENAEKDAFADLLESTSQNDDPFSAPTAPPVPAAAAESTGEFDMNNFSWDEPAPASGDLALKPGEESFNSLFGDKDDATK
jgi:predicted  nucleic acid-binding Zn-ribbon protein